MTKFSTSQLDSWASAPAGTKFQTTYASVKKALEASNNLSGRDYTVYLQGSYANSTNIRSESDVDIVVQLNSVWSRDLTQLPQEQADAYKTTYPNSKYGYKDFRADVIKALHDYYGQSNIKEGNKSLKVTGTDSRLYADVLPCLQYRKYVYFYSHDNQKFIPGVRFLTKKEEQEIVNYPKVHIDHGEKKNAQHRTNEKYKDLVRIAKSIKHKLSDDGIIDPAIAPSYFIECAIYNVPDPLFSNDHSSNLKNAVNYLLYGPDDADFYTAVNHEHKLFGPNPWEWNMQNALEFFQSVERHA